MKPALFLSSLLAFATLPLAHGDPLTSEQGRAILHDHQDSVVPLVAVLTLTVAGKGTDREVHYVGSVLTEDGLIVAPLAMIDPAAALAAAATKMKISSETKELKIVLPDGAEVPAELVLRDTDLNLAFLRPKAGQEETKDVKFHALDLKDAAEADIADQVITFARLKKSTGYQAAGGISAVFARVEKPYRSYYVGGATPGTPVYTAGGKLLGIATIAKSEDSEDKNPQTIVLPAKDFLRTMQQAKDAKAPKADDADAAK